VAFLVITIPLPLFPLERGKRFEAPLLAAFEAFGIDGEVVGGGSLLGKSGSGRVVESCDIELEVSDVGRALPVIRRVLVAGGAPPQTVIHQTEPEDIVFPMVLPS
jgi:hypothetical protein